MIHFNHDTRTFNLILQYSVYAMQVDSKDRLVHLVGVVPVGDLTCLCKRSQKKGEIR